MSGISIKLEAKGKTCWLCGTNKNLTKAHVIPKWLQPKRNMRIVLCVSCHKKCDLRFQFQRQLRDTIHELRKVVKEYEMLSEVRRKGGIG